MAAPSTMPVARSRLRTRWTPMHLHRPRAEHATPDEAGERGEPEVAGAGPAGGRHVGQAWPANDWLRMTVKTPTTAETTAVTAR